MTTMTTTTTPVGSNSNMNKVTMTNQREEEDESAALLAPAAADGRNRSICGVMKKKRKQVDLPAFSLRKIHFFRSSSSSIVSDSIEPHAEKQESSVAETYMNLFREYNHPHQHPKPQFVLIHGAEIV
jgi:hypothetical protein